MFPFQHFGKNIFSCSLKDIIISFEDSFERSKQLTQFTRHYSVESFNRIFGLFSGESDFDLLKKKSEKTHN